MQDITNTARQIVGHPQDHLDDTALFTAAWATLKAARGQRFDPARLRAAHLYERPTPPLEPLEQTLDRIARKTRSIAESKGYRLPAKRAA
ncbi:hypothetical protein NIT7321_01655 [Phaeobacter italicus]|uniref:Uncharacterized protein n=1 Tax=Phaeobacter italicus TaxID=481446 RepID=A0A0H5D0P6_9RHOB|nr:hypothetical protein [Phaeobacter italicus]CRL10807.1 hypothetical protein NIT7321_01655 [Phaeobacter italicus]